VPYVALLLAACLAGAVWISDGRGRAWCVGLTVLATLQRQVGLAIPAALTLCLLLEARARGLVWRDYAGVALLWLGTVAAVVVPALAGIAPQVQGQFLSGLGGLDPAHLLRPLEYMPAVIGLCLLPFLPALLAVRDPRRWDAVSGALLAIALFGLLLWLRSGQHLAGLGVFPGNVWTPIGLTPTSLLGAKPSPFPNRLYLAVEVAALAVGAGLLWRWREWTPRRLGGQGLFLALTAVAQLGFVLLNPLQVLDRYYVAVAAPLVPLAALAASRARWQPFVAAGGLAIAAAGLAVFAAGQQDYEAWQEARDRAARLAYMQASPELVQAGYEANGVYALGPALEAGRGKRPSLQTELELIRGPEQPQLALEYAGPDDPRPGAGYSSAASGRIVIVPGPNR
jgi:hypothetical protein